MPALTDYRQAGDPIEQATAALGIPLPHHLNDTHDDVLRIRLAFELLDTNLQLMALDMDSRDDALAARAALLEWAAGRPSAVQYGFDGQGRVATVTQTIAGQVRTATITYDAQGRMVTAAYPVAGGATRTETYHYDNAGRFTGRTAVEGNP